ncbi:MAG: pyridoxal phosphate-dependent aminotransferase [Spirochaetota bacterium]
MENRVAGALRRARRQPDFLSLIDTNFHSCGLHPDDSIVRAAFSDYLSSHRRDYDPDPAGLRELREAVSRFYAESSLACTPQSLVITASASESYRHIFTGHCRRGAKVLLPRPGYPLFEEVALRCGLEPDFYDLRFHSGWRIDEEQIGRKIDVDTAALVVISPNNPTGAIVGEETMRALGLRCRETGIALIVDEVFSEYRFANPSPLPRPAVLCPETLVFTINGASKLLASPDLKVSWIAVSGPEEARSQAIEELEIENDLYLNGSPMNQYVTSRLLSALEPTRERLINLVADRRATMLAELESIARRHPEVSWVEPAGGIHLPIVFGENPAGLDDEEITIALLDRYALAVHPGYLYGFDAPTTLVASYLSPSEAIREGMRRLDAFLSSPGTSRRASP